MQYLSFFLYTRIPAEELPALRDSLHAMLDAIGAGGRIFIATEGINAQMCAPVEHMAQMESSLRALHGGVFRSVELTLGNVHHPSGAVSAPGDIAPTEPPPGAAPFQPPFTALHVRVRHRLVADGLDAETHERLDLHDHGEGLDAAQWHAAMKEVESGRAHPNTRVIDVRNWFESEIGGFVPHAPGALPLGTDLYKQSFDKLDEIFQADAASPPTKNGTPPQTTYIYCTGGIRCVKVGAYLRSKGHSQIKFLKGGINAYIKLVQEKTKQAVVTDASVTASATPAAALSDSVSASASSPPPFQSVFRGKNFVFDSRIKEGNASVRITPDVLGACHQCGDACDVHVNCKNLRCDVLFLQCRSCADEYEHTCSDECRTILRAVKAEKMSFSDLPPHPGQQYYRRRVGLAATRADRPTVMMTQMRTDTPTAAFHAWTRTHSARRAFSTAAAAAPSTAAPSLSALDAYCASHSTPTPSSRLLADISSHTLASMPERANMLSEPVVGALLRAIVTACTSHAVEPRLLELGTFTGYSTSWLLDTLPRGRGTLISCESKEEHAAVARPLLAQHDNFSQLQLRLAPALDTLQSLVDDGAAPFHFVYIDANKKSYGAYVDFLLTHSLLARGGAIVLDNTLWKGLVAAPEEDHDSMTRSIHALNQRLANDDRLLVTMLPIRDGITIVQRRE